MWAYLILTATRPEKYLGNLIFAQSLFLTLRVHFLKKHQNQKWADSLEFNSSRARLRGYKNLDELTFDLGLTLTKRIYSGRAWLRSKVSSSNSYLWARGQVWFSAANSHTSFWPSSVLASMAGFLSMRENSLLAARLPFVKSGALDPVRPTCIPPNMIAPNTLQQ